MSTKKSEGAGKGDGARNNYSRNFFERFEEIDWSVKYKHCEQCGAEIHDFLNPERQLVDSQGNTIYVCNKEHNNE